MQRGIFGYASMRDDAQNSLLFRGSVITKHIVVPTCHPLSAYHWVVVPENSEQREPKFSEFSHNFRRNGIASVQPTVRRVHPIPPALPKQLRGESARGSPHGLHC